MDGGSSYVAMSPVSAQGSPKTEAPDEPQVAAELRKAALLLRQAADVQQSKVRNADACRETARARSRTYAG
jgi:hypothetical protein